MTSAAAAEPALIDSISKIYPSYNYSALTPQSYDRWFNVMTPAGGCFPTLFTTFAFNITSDQISKKGWYNEETPQKWQNLIQNGRQKFAGPLLVINGLSDSVVRPAGVQSAVDDTCTLLKKTRDQTSLEHHTYEGMDHFSAIQASQMKWMGWIKDRLAGEKVYSRGCSVTKHSGITSDFTIETGSPNFFLDWFPAAEFWKYVL